MSNNIFINIKTQAEGLKAKLQGVRSSMTNLGRNTRETSGNFAKFYNETKKVNNSLSNITKNANSADKSLRQLKGGMNGINQLIGGAKAFAIGNAMAYAIKSSMDMIETTNLFNVAMGELAIETNETALAMSRLYGLDTTNIQSTIGTYQVLARSMGLTNQQAQTLSTNTAKLSVDLSSLFNIPIQQVMSDLRSGLVGQSETVYKYGIDITEASLVTEALRQGITKTVRNMSQGEKMA